MHTISALQQRDRLVINYKEKHKEIENDVSTHNLSLLRKKDPVVKLVLIKIYKTEKKKTRHLRRKSFSPKLLF